MGGIGAWLIRRLRGGHGPLPSRAVLAGVTALLAVAFVAAPLCFVAGVLVVLFGEVGTGFLVLAGSVVGGAGALFAAVGLGVRAVRRLTDQLVVPGSRVWDRLSGGWREPAGSQESTIRGEAHWHDDPSAGAPQRGVNADRR